MRALVSVFDKKGSVELCQALVKCGADLVSTGGTFQALSQAGLDVKQISDLTGFPEILDGRVKTLHPLIYGGILARRDHLNHMDQIDSHSIGLIDVVVVNLYPFEATITRPAVTSEEALENIDIGGPSLLRAAAKNHPFVTVLVDPNDYSWVADKLSAGGLTLDERRGLASKAFQHVALYDTVIAQWLKGDSGYFTDEFTLGLRKISALRYGENPHQIAALYADVPGGGGVVGATQLHGKELSFNNILDANAAWIAVSDFPDQTVAIVKHTNPCGLSSHEDQAEAYLRANAGDPVSAFGGIVGFNRSVTVSAAEAMRPVFYEVVVAPDYEPEALAILRKKRDLRILRVPEGIYTVGAQNTEARRVSGGVLLQSADVSEDDPSEWSVRSERQPSNSEQHDLAFAWRIAKHLKSNAIVLVKDRTLVGMGAGQPNRVTSVHLALRAAGENAQGAVLASDAFFPFADGVELAAQHGVTAVIQPGGSIRDDEVIRATDTASLAMLFTGRRHFKH